MINGKKIKIKDVKPLVKNTLKGIRAKKNDVYYEQSQKFRKKKGFYYEEVWNLDQSIAAFILPRLIHFRDNHLGIPNDYCKFAEDGFTIINMKEARKQWINDIALMIEAFYYIMTKDVSDDKKYNDIIDKGLKLFSTNLTNLWD